MKKTFVCIECPKGCRLIAESEGSRLISVSGQQCPRGEAYARAETENPQRFVTGTVRCEGLNLKRLPVRTDRPVPKDRVAPIMQEIRTIVITQPLGCGALVQERILGLDANLVATRRIQKAE